MHPVQCHSGQPETMDGFLSLTAEHRFPFFRKTGERFPFPAAAENKAEDGKGADHISAQR